MNRFFSIWMFFCCLSVATVQAASFYADASQTDDSGDGTSWASAKKTLQAAVDLAGDSDTVWVTNGVYSSGGRAAGSWALTNRLVITNDVTVRSVNGPDVTAIEGAGPNGPAAIRCVFMNAGLLEGFTLTNGHTFASGYDSDNCGGGAFFEFGGAVSNCVISSNAAGYEGGGAFIDHVGLVTDSLLVGNQAVNGGGVSCWEEGDVSHCVFSNNTALLKGGGANGANGLWVDRSVFIGNSAGDGGGQYNGFAQNSLFTGNHATNSAGGAWITSTLRNCTLSGNSADVQGGGLVCDQFSTIENSIIYGNSAPTGSNYWSSFGSATFYFCCASPLPSAGSDNLSVDPQFAAAGDYRLLPGSDCVDAGDNSVVETSLDLNGETRVADSAVDIGAYEYVTGQDYDSDGISNEWENQYFGGVTNAEPSALAANGINTLLETYIAGLDPTSSTDRLLLNAIQPLQWTAVPGRVYTIYWSSNLLNGFQTLETNFTGGSFTDTVHSAEDNGFYKIEVQLAP